MKNWDSIKTAVASAAKTAQAAALSVSSAVVLEVQGAKALQGYTLSPVASSNAWLGWKVHLCTSKQPGGAHPVVSAWILDKAGASREVYELCKREVHFLAKLKHPSILRLISPLEETRTQLVFLTEPIVGSLAELMPTGNQSFSALELKHGLLQVAEGLSFLHTNASLVHCALCPHNIVVTRGSGTWKLAGFGLVTSLDYAEQVPQPPSWRQLLPYLAPELALNKTSQPTSAADVFSLAAVAFELLVGRQLLPVRDLIEYSSSINSLPFIDMSSAPSGLDMLRQMIAVAPEVRPPVASFGQAFFFSGDTALRALSFLEHMVQKDPTQRAAFMRDLPRIIGSFEPTLLKQKVLPPLLMELRNKDTQTSVLPIVLNIIRHQEPEEFTDVTLPALQLLLETGSRETLILLVENVELLQNTAPPVVSASLVPSILLQALSTEDIGCQETALQKTAALAQSLDYSGIKRIMPAVHHACLATTSAAVRISSFKALAATAARADDTEADMMLQTCARVTTVDKTPATAMCVFGLGDILAQTMKAKFAAEKVLPVLSPLLVVPSLSRQQFNTAMKTVNNVLEAIESSRGYRPVGKSAVQNGGGADWMEPLAGDLFGGMALQQQQPLELNSLLSGTGTPAMGASAMRNSRSSRPQPGALDMLSGIDFNLAAQPPMAAPQAQPSQDPFDTLFMQHAKPASKPIYSTGTDSLI